jgi:hypothetical protein
MRFNLNPKDAASMMSSRLRGHTRSALTGRAGSILERAVAGW